MTKTTIPATFTEPKQPAAEPRTITYPLKTGGTITVTCPGWCTADHTSDVATGLVEPGDLSHDGDVVALEYQQEGRDHSVLQARLVQWPFATDDSRPYVELVPEGSTGLGIALTSAVEVDNEIRKVQAHLRLLMDLSDKLAEAQAADHAADHRGDLTPWASLTRTDLASLPLPYLIRVFGITVVETEDIGRKAVLALYGEPGAMELRVLPDVPQVLRESQTRRALIDWHTARGGAA
ncbi:hypothetical protein [Streptomyces sp. NPDC093260]|uniref:DUF6907 domain-containing protein n=1 Tax=Streptomyces sp. NPDC093260 TaxID=3155073 RepID=UPI0034462F24